MPKAIFDQRWANHRVRMDFYDSRRPAKTAVEQVFDGAGDTPKSRNFFSIFSSAGNRFAAGGFAPEQIQAGYLRR
ncbi:hypothetical protein ACVW1C_005524 [Bradyrhizobium sp. USDA 4011]